jgi:methylmalonyl-CoA/ethylmalonyl-CoA epimerase
MTDDLPGSLGAASIAGMTRVPPLIGAAMRIAQIAQHAEDLERATAFYTELLGEGPVASFDPPGLVFFRLGDTRLLLESGAPSAMIYLHVQHVRDWVASWRERGHEIETEPHVIFTHADDTLGPAGHAEWMAFLRDSEGNLVGVISHEPA